MRDPQSCLPTFFPICWLSHVLLGKYRREFDILRFGLDVIDVAWCGGKNVGLEIRTQRLWSGSVICSRAFCVDDFTLGWQCGKSTRCGDVDSVILLIGWFFISASKQREERARIA